MKPDPVLGLKRIPITVRRILHARKFDPREKKPATLEYLLVGRGSEHFLVHAISGPPDFDHVVSVSLIDRELTDRDLMQNIRLVVPDRENVAMARLRPGQRVEATLRIGSTPPAKVRLEVGPEIHFEEGDLLMPPNFDETEEEKKSELRTLHNRGRTLLAARQRVHMGRRFE
jgi:hypothetical protein